MRQLEVVALSDDGTHVLLASDSEAARATHAVRIDHRLQAALRGELEDPEHRESELPVKDIQARLRAGETVEQVAKLAKVPVARVMRYAGPVISERDRIVEQARAAKVQRPRGPESTLPLGEAVDKRLAATTGLRTDTVAWTARRRDDGAWIVELSYAGRGGRRAATWLWEPAGRRLTAVNPLGSRLVAEEAPPHRRAAAKPAAAKPARASSARSTSKTKARPSAKRATKSTARKAAPRAASVVKPAKPRVAPPPRQRREVEPVVESPARRTNGRVPVPSWSDVFFGVQRPAREASSRERTRGRRRS
ncbi:MAG TPA: septation protein SepH [Mycobacteriales bacterium]|nr:septation protein SepH [Mycobacteriales bacterium]